MSTTARSASRSSKAGAFRLSARAPARSASRSNTPASVTPSIAAYLRAWWSPNDPAPITPAFRLLLTGRLSVGWDDNSDVRLAGSNPHGPPLARNPAEVPPRRDADQGQFRTGQRRGRRARRRRGSGQEP